MKFFHVLFSLALLFAPVRAQEKSGASGKSENTLVSGPVIISDREGRYVPGLKKEDFTIFQNGVKQNITFFATFDEPINVALLLDTSGSTEDVSKKIRNAAKNFVELLNPQDKCLLATFDNQVKILNPFTSDRRTLEKSLDEIKSAKLGGTLMYNAVEQVTKSAFDDVAGRKVVVLLTDGVDFGSVVTKDELLGQFEESDILIYTVFYRTSAVSNAANGAKSKGKRKKKNLIVPTGTVYVPTEAELAARERRDEAEALDALKKMSDATAGRFYLSDSPDLSRIFRQVAGELREQYRLGYRSTDAAAQDVIIKVARPDAVVRFRGKFRVE